MGFFLGCKFLRKRQKNRTVKTQTIEKRNATALPSAERHRRTTTRHCWSTQKRVGLLKGVNFLYCRFFFFLLFHSLGFLSLLPSPIFSFCALIFAWFSVPLGPFLWLKLQCCRWIRYFSFNKFYLSLCSSLDWVCCFWHCLIVLLSLWDIICESWFLIYLFVHK